MPKSILDRLSCRIEDKSDWQVVIKSTNSRRHATVFELEMWNLLKELDANTMTEAKAKKLLEGYIQKDGTLHNPWADETIFYEKDNETALTDGHFTAEQYRAIAWWMDNHEEKL